MCTKKEVVIIVIDMNVKDQTIIVYLANEETAPDIKSFKAAYPQFMIALMRSGCGNCKELTAALLTNNK